MSKQIVNLPPNKAKQLNEIIAADAEFLASLGIMDYSMNLVVESRKLALSHRKSGYGMAPIQLRLSRNEVLS